MAFDPQLTIEHGLATSHDIQRSLDEADLAPPQRPRQSKRWRDMFDTMQILRLKIY